MHGIIFSAVLLINPKFKSKTNLFLAFTTISLCASNFQYLLLDIGVVLRKSYESNLIFIPFEFLMVPFFYLFIMSYLNRKVNSIFSRIIFIPFILAVFYQIITRLFGFKYYVIDLMNKGAELISVIFSILLIVFIFKEIKLYNLKINSPDFLEVPKTTKWLKKTLFFGLILCFLWFVSITFFKSYFGKGLQKYYPLWIGISVIIYWIGYVSVIQNILYKERKSLRKKSINKNTSNKKPNKQKFEETHKFILENHLYLNPKMSLSFLSDKTNISQGYLSQLINKNFQKNFNDYINGLRIEYVKKILTNNEYKNYTITAIGLESGFRTKTSFYTAFKKHTGKTPNEYKKLVQNL